MVQLRSLFLSALSGVLLCSSALMGQTSTVAARITSEINESSLTMLKGNVPQSARTEFDQGAADSSTQLTHVRLVLARSAEQQAALDTYLAELQNKSSSNYHKWLTPVQFGKLYGPADSDVAAIVAWLESHGMTVESVSTGRTNISFSGSVSQIEAAFHTSIHSFTANGQQFYSNTTNPKIPAALSSVVKGVAHLNTIKPKTFSRQGQPGVLNKQTGQLTPLSTATTTSQARSLLSYENSSGYYYLYVVPADAATIYNTPNSLLNANYTSGTTYTGSGVTIGIGGDAVISTTPVVNYRTSFLSPYAATAPTITNVGSNTLTDDADEAYIDTELAAGLAPGATIHYYHSSDLTSAIERALSDNTVDIFSLSFGECESDLGTSGNAQFAGYWEQAAAQGIAVTVSSGDSGSAGCDYPTDTSGNTVTQASGGLAVNGLASTLYNIAVGGTDYYPLASSFSTYVTAPSAVKTIAGSSSTYYRTAKSYIPESTWNDSTQLDGLLSANYPWTGTSANIVAGGGGVSTIYAKPSWQRGTGVPSDSVRDIPDISLLGADGMDGAVWLICTADYPCSSISSTSSFTGYGGTSTSAPAFAGMLALVQQSQGGDRLGQAAVNLYNLYNNSNASTVFHDVIEGNISVPCKSGSTDCSTNSAGYSFLTGYDTTTGYDLATGMGSVDVAKLISYWSTTSGSATATVSVQPASSSILIGESLNVLVTVSGTSSAPTGTVLLTTGDYTSSDETLTAGSTSSTYTFTIPADDLSVGTNTITVTYNADSTYLMATGTATVTVTTGSTTSSTSLAASSTTPTYGTSVTLTATVLPTAATGKVIFYDGSTKLGTGTLSSGTATYTTSTLAVGTHTIKATYSGSTTYASSTSSSVTVTVSSSSSSGTGSFAITVTNATVSQGSSGTSTVTVTPASSYTGTVGLVLSTSSTSLQNYGCYDVSNVVVTGTSSVQTTLTIYTSESACSSTAAVKSGVRHSLVKTGAKSISSSQGSSPWRKTLPIGASALAGILLFGLRKSRAKWFNMLGCFLLLGILSCAVGCGSSTTTTTSNNVAKGTYSLTLTGTDTSYSTISSSATFTLTVN